MLERFLSDLEHLVNIDSGSWNAAGVNRVGDFAAARLVELGFAVERVAVPPVDGVPLGDVVVGRRPGQGPRILLLAHLDTVFDDGTAAARPFTVRDGIAHGPGVCDDKAGLAAGLAAVDALDADADLVFCCTPDEELGAPGSHPVLAELAAEADYALCLECAREDGSLVKARKGGADVRVTITGRAAHAGIEPERGANAALAAAHLVIALQSLNDPAAGTTVNVGVVRAGSRPNVVCPEAVLEVDVRAVTTDRLTRVLDDIDALVATTHVEGTSATGHRHGVCPPMEPSEDLAAVAVGLAAARGLDVAAVATAGIADANLVSALGVPTLDGLGPVGGADHSPAEWLDLASVTPRVTLLAELITHLATKELP
ncbi:M20/M25/M40 family metallo-hydrolase [Nonomuraea sediminis]|uniref:M20/M25/M40 family metallo-hydrolase n=1 Tax=Nonomuraea sediminis TaxID=2835864 RepID=UPI001BDD3579|nr:M20/M25/M40 family metallo-hydrolase [Nonomuraea sediminis]